MALFEIKTVGEPQWLALCTSNPEGLGLIHGWMSFASHHFFLAHNVHEDLNKTVCLIVSCLPQLIQVGMFAVTFRDSFHAPVLVTIKEEVVRLKLIVF